MKKIKTITAEDKAHSLPLLEYVGERYIGEKRPFWGYKILAVQHLLGSSIPLFLMLEKGGALRQDIYVVGKAYSSHPSIVKKLVSRGYNLSFADVFTFVDNKPYDSVLEKNILRFCSVMVEKGLKDKRQKALIIDDGGKAIQLVHRRYPHLLGRVCSVEQTSRGARALASMQLSMPVVNVARSEAKTILESPIIAKIMVQEFINSLDEWNKTKVFQLKDNKILVLGYGFIGEHVVYELLKLGFDIAVYDPDHERLKKAADIPKIKPISRRSGVYSDVSVIIGCSGKPSIPIGEFQRIRPGTLLVNMASTDTEFSAWRFRNKQHIVHQRVLPSDELYLQEFFPLPWRSLYRINERDTFFYLANGGFPIDFCGKVNPVPVDEIQLTTALLLIGAIQATRETQSGLINLDPVMQDELVTQYISTR